MAASRYRRFLKLCEEWPVDESRRGRDLGAVLRQRVAQAFKEGENTEESWYVLKGSIESLSPGVHENLELALATKQIKMNDCLSEAYTLTPAAFQCYCYVMSARGLSQERHHIYSRQPRKFQDPESCDQMYESLSRLNSNYYREKYPRLQDTSFTEITVDEYRMVLATDTLKQMDEMKKGMWTRLKDKFNAKSQDEMKE
ncbi:ubiquinol-cytochrome c reductase complex assembly factor 2 isoform X1 [Ranitomeya variabilis]|uniref:ubiquinol-cytochrome c reductase complex assembly factor 2 isoform X1 n=1 Tax=Ranitomeya variabilis TaxID=490064 RepID=UPI0040578C88